MRKGGKEEGGERQCALVLSVLPHSLHVGIGHIIQCTCKPQGEIIELLVIYWYNIIAHLTQCHLNWLSQHGRHQLFWIIQRR